MLPFVRHGPEFIAENVYTPIAAVEAKTTFFEPGSPRENGHCESFNARFLDELLSGKVFYTLREAHILIKKWRRHDKHSQAPRRLGIPPPAPETIAPMNPRPTIH